MARRLSSIAALGLLAAAMPASASADDTLVLMDEPTSFVDVMDAFDEHDAFDLQLGVGYLRSWALGRIQRQFNGADAANGRAAYTDIGNYENSRNGLMISLDVGIFRDVAIYGRLPLILSDDRSISRVNGNDPTAGLNAGGAPLFSVGPDGLRSATRSGVDWIGVGLAWSMLNQHRDDSVPTWLLMIEGRFNAGDPMRPCLQAEGGSASCGDGMAGVGRGVNALRIETRASYRTGILEPYGSFAFQAEFPGSAGDLFTPTGNLAGYINRIPPLVGTFLAGLAIHPWEDRERFQRFTIDLRGRVDYISEGRDYSPLYDALGTSTNQYLTQPNLNGIPDPNADGLEQVSFNGLTDTQGHARLGAQLALEVRAAEIVRFQFGAGVGYQTPYLLTQTDACNPNVGAVTDERLRGTCRTGIINPQHRPAIDLPGQRFRIDGVVELELFAQVQAQF